METISELLDLALEDEHITAIVLDIDSPGGTVDGTFELADNIFRARREKPVYAFSDGMMASAAYAIGAAAEAVYLSGPAVHVGSIGIVSAHVDYSGAEKQMGIKTTEMFAGKYKRITSAYEPLSDEGRAIMQEQVDYMYSLFVDIVAAYRGVSIKQVLENMADGRVFIGEQVITAGLADGFTTLDGLIEHLSIKEGVAS